MLRMEVPKDDAKPRQLKQSVSLFQAIMYGTGLILGLFQFPIYTAIAGLSVMAASVLLYKTKSR